MRRAVLVCLIGLGLAACSTAHRAAQRAHSAADKAAESAREATHPAVNPVGMDKPEKEGVQGAVEAPLEDVNVVRRQIPPILLQAEDAPYARPSPASCRQVANEVQGLDDALGDDLDVNEPEDSSPDAKHERQAGEAVVLAMRDTAEDFIPFRNWVRRLSGAQAHDNQIRAAVYAGRERRSYLKGLGEALGCRYPAAPKGASPMPASASRPR